MTDFDILVPGHYYCDLIFTGLDEFPALGTEIYARGMELVPGGAINTVVALHRLGVRVGWIGVLGSDFASRFVEDWLVQEGIDLSLVERRDTPFRRVTAALSYPTDRAFVTYNDPRLDLIPMLQDALTHVQPRWLHFTGLLIDSRLPPLLQTWRSRGIKLSMDCQHRPHTLDMPLVRDTLNQIDVFMPNATETLRLSGEPTLDQAAAVLKAFVPMLVVKDGANGSWLWDESGKHHAPALPVTPLDTTGAGDAFNGGFLSAALMGHDWVTGLRWGNICGGLSTLGYGGASSAPNKHALDAALAR